MRPRSLPILLAATLLAAGCGGARDAGAPHIAAVKQQAAAVPQAAGALAKPAPPEAERKIIRNGEVQVIVDRLDEAEQKLRQQVANLKGYVDAFEIQETPGSPRSGSWTVRVPAEHFDDLVDAVSRLGEVRRRSSNSEDVTDRYYDMAAHLKNDESEEKTLRELLEKTSGKVEDILTVRRALNDVRGRIEVQKAQLLRWDRDTRMSTVIVRLYDRKDYRAPIIPDFSSTIGSTFQGSLELMLSVGKGLVLAAVAVAPWLLVVALLLTPFAWRRRRRRGLARGTPDAG